MILKVFIILLLFLAVSHALSCYHCIGQDCEKGNVSEVTCGKNDELCMTAWNFDGRYERGCATVSNGFSTAVNSQKWTDHSRFACNTDFCNRQKFCTPDGISKNRTKPTGSYSELCYVCKDCETVTFQLDPCHDRCYLSWEYTNIGSTIIKGCRPKNLTTQNFLEEPIKAKNKLKFEYYCAELGCNGGKFNCISELPEIKTTPSTTTTTTTVATTSESVMLEASKIAIFCLVVFLFV